MLIKILYIGLLVNVCSSGDAIANIRPGSDKKYDAIVFKDPNKPCRNCTNVKHHVHPDTQGQSECHGTEPLENLIDIVLRRLKNCKPTLTCSSKQCRYNRFFDNLIYTILGSYKQYHYNSTSNCSAYVYENNEYLEELMGSLSNLLKLYKPNAENCCGVLNKYKMKVDAGTTETTIQKPIIIKITTITKDRKNQSTTTFISTIAKELNITTKGTKTITTSTTEKSPLRKKGNIFKVFMNKN